MWTRGSGRMNVWMRQERKQKERERCHSSLSPSLDSPSFVSRSFWCTTPRHIYLRQSSGILSPNPRGRVSFLNLPLLCQHLFCNSLAGTLGFRARLKWQISAAPTAIPFAARRIATAGVEGRRRVVVWIQMMPRLAGLYSAMNLNVYHRGKDFCEAGVSLSEQTDVKSSGSGACKRQMEGRRGTWRNEAMRRWKDPHRYQVFHLYGPPSIHQFILLQFSHSFSSLHS